MALPPLLKHIYNHGNEEVVKRGKKIFLLGGVTLLKIDEISEQASFRVRNDMYYNHYTVTISRFQSDNNISVRCQCPYNMGEICRHEVAALFHLNDLIVTQQLTSANTSFDQSMTVIRMRQIELKLLRLFTSEHIFSLGETISLSTPAQIVNASDEKVEAIYTLKKEKFNVSLKRNDDKTYNTSCTCIETNYALCQHKIALFLQLINNYGSGYFDSIRNWDTQKNKLLQQYGYTLKDNLDGKFDFNYYEGKPILRVLDASIKKVNATESLFGQKSAKDTVIEANTNKRLGIVINANEKQFPYFSIDIAEGEPNENKSKFIDTIAKIDITKYLNLDKYVEVDKTMIQQVRKLLPTEVNKFISKNNSFGDIWENIIVDVDKDISDDNKKLFIEYLHPKMLNLFSHLALQAPIYYLEKGKAYNSKNLIPLNLITSPLQAHFTVGLKKKKGYVQAQLKSASNTFALTDNELQSNILFLANKQLYTVANTNTVLQLNKLQELNNTENWNDTLQNIILPLSKLYAVDFKDGILKSVMGDLSSVRVYLSEHNDHFIIKPVFIYNNNEADWNADISMHIAEGNELKIIQRDKTSEEEWINQLKTLSEYLKPNADGGTLYITAQHALKGNWFYTFFDTLKKWKVQILGYEKLQKFKVSRAKPTTSLHVSSGVDWFDTEVNVKFDGQLVDVQEIKKALSVQKNFIQLGDGSYGILPEEWLSKYSLLFKMAEGTANKLRVSKYNFSVIDDLYEAIDDEKIKQELWEKKENLLNLNPENVLTLALPQGLDATLRPYQESGFNWLGYLNKVQWGGLLADDMGLGKTIQTLTFLQHFLEKNNSLHALVVCPTTLLYNWESEIKKFTPALTSLIHHSSARTNKKEVLWSYNVIITTYGTLRSDIELLMQMNMDYVILDESQAIKNPSSKVTKAAMLLHTNNKIALSGTPLQNNTFDIYAQLNFLNPGMLGTKEFFKDNFATPIDKFQEATTKEHLRKLIYPFLLRRTKEQVAKDLPDKTEITLYCEMLPPQRKLYDAYKNMYRAKILGDIEEQGIDKTQFAILQGLMKLRQICDSPAILKEDVQLENHSIKLDELVRELTENIGNHKVLIFSQFLGMLALIKEKLTATKIDFEYFDGSYTSKQRMSAIDNFQNNPECRAFLISLKAGGTGLNLTAADYVYIMDPWWNPAVEQQAIDRTHRIGQTKNIFAYRFICKDTVEEKIVELKQKKNSLVRDIIADDENFVKKLSKEDVMYLFS
jgi:SNF2 family DNA or RNA helicase